MNPVVFLDVNKGGMCYLYSLSWLPKLQ
ncbi:unnamed protein product [Debaryomyces tyrocola]|nr:unnamed protein product [Debaryomyces tyrocola]